MLCDTWVGCNVYQFLVKIIIIEEHKYNFSAVKGILKNLHVCNARDTLGWI